MALVQMSLVEQQYRAVLVVRGGEPTAASNDSHARSIGNVGLRLRTGAPGNLNDRASQLRPWSTATGRLVVPLRRSRQARRRSRGLPSGTFGMASVARSALVS